MELPPGEILLSSSPIEGDKLPANTAVWLRVLSWVPGPSGAPGPG